VTGSVTIRRRIASPSRSISPPLVLSLSRRRSSPVSEVPNCHYCHQREIHDVGSLDYPTLTVSYIFPYPGFQTPLLDYTNGRWVSEFVGYLIRAGILLVLICSFSVPPSESYTRLVWAPYEVSRPGLSGPESRTAVTTKDGS